MAAPTGGSWWRTPRALVGATALTDLLARAPQDTIAPVLSLLGGMAPGPTVASVTSWLLAGAVFYLFAPLVYSLSDVIPREAHGFRVLFASSAVALGILWTSLSGFTTEVGFFLLLGACAISGGVIQMYLSWVRGWDLLDPHGPVSENLDLFTPHQNAPAELESQLRYEGILGVFNNAIILLAHGLLLGLPIVLAGAVTLFLRFAYPFPDLLFLGWVGGAALTARISFGPDTNQMPESKVDIERYVVDALENITRGVQGFFLSLAIIIGMLVATGYLIGGSGLITSYPTALDWLAQAITLRDHTVFVAFWNYVGATILLFSTGGFVLWAWLREWQRLPHFLDQWEHRDLSTAPLTPRPPGLVALPVAVGTLVFTLMSTESSFYPGSLLGYGFTVLWPVILGIGVVTVSRTFEQPPQPVTYENYWITGAVLLEILSLTPVLIEVGDPWFLGISLAVLVFMCGLPVVYRHAKDASGLAGYAVVWYLFGWTAILLAFGPVLPTDSQGSLSLLIGIFLLSGIVVGLSRWSDVSF